MTSAALRILLVALLFAWVVTAVARGMVIGGDR
jgi:hypothetical protein